MAFAPETVSFDRGDASILGGFYEKERGNWFEFSRNDDDFDFAKAIRTRFGSPLRDKASTAATVMRR